MFHRSGDRDAPDLSLSESTVDGVRVLRLVNHLKTRRLDETWRRIDVEAVFEDVLRRERPHVVHFQHLLHLSAGLPALARRAGAGVVVTLHDYWTRCPRVQLVRADGSVCEGPPPGLGCVACVNGDASRIERLAAASRFASGALEGLALRTLVPAAWRADALALRERPGAMREALGAAHVVTVPSRFLRDKLAEADLATSSLVVVRNAVETRRLQGYARPARNGPLRVGFVGSLVAHKGLVRLAEAAARLPPGTVRLEVHGDASSQPEFRETAERARAAAPGREIAFHGAFAPGELGRVLSTIDVLAVPSLWYENAPLTILEALALRVPVVASDAGGMRELLAGERGGVLVPMGDAEALAGALARLANEPGLAERLAAAAPDVPGLDFHAREMELRYRQAAGLARGTAPE